ncbi:MAG: glutamine-hydrolyzing GMP synthase [Eubacteriales bacterium]|nr:glutamine-hydrolyzing GMP synthase [Eubacteriales bacterium]
MILIVDFGAQYSQLIARRVREAKVYCEIVPYDVSLDRIKEKKPSGIILSGGPASVYEDFAPNTDKGIFDLGIPVLGICYGGQLIAQTYGGKVARASSREFGRILLDIDQNSILFKGFEKSNKCWMSHTDYIERLPKEFQVTASSDACPVAAFENEQKQIYAVQFHPEVEHTDNGREVFNNFVFNICEEEPAWDMGNYAEETILKIKDTVGDRKALCALSGGVDSSVAAVLVHRAIGKNLICVFVDHGLLRKDEGDQVERVFKEEFNMNLIRVNAQERFLGKLKGISDPEQKRKIIGEEFIRVFEEEKNKLKDVFGHIDYLVQGTIYPDVIESGTSTAAVIKSHHNVGGLPEDVDFELLEPLRQLFKDEVRQVGRELGISNELVERQPFPGPGLAIRVLGEITEDKLHLVREADFIFRDEVKKAGLQNQIWQYFACLPNIRSVGVMGDERTYSHTVALRAVTSTDGMTSDWARIPYEVLEKVSNRIVNEVDNVNRIVYDITSKPPSTIEWE